MGVKDEVKDVLWSILPGWFKKFIALGSGAAALIIAFAKDPLGFIMERVLSWFVKASFWITAQIGLFMLDMWGLVSGVVVEAFAAAFGPPGRALAGLVLDIISLINSIVTGLVGSTGPLGIFVLVVVYAVVLYGLLALVQLIRQRIVGLLTGAVST